MRAAAAAWILALLAVSLLAGCSQAPRGDFPEDFLASSHPLPSGVEVMPTSAAAFAPFSAALHQNPGTVDPSVYQGNSTAPRPAEVAMAVLWNPDLANATYASIAIRMASDADADEALRTTDFCPAVGGLFAVLRQGPVLAFVAGYGPDARPGDVAAMVAAIRDSTGAAASCPSQAS